MMRSIRASKHLSAIAAVMGVIVAIPALIWIATLIGGGSEKVEVSEPVSSSDVTGSILFQQPMPDTAGMDVVEMGRTTLEWWWSEGTVIGYVLTIVSVAVVLWIVRKVLRRMVTPRAIPGENYHEMLYRRKRAGKRVSIMFLILLVVAALAATPLVLAPEDPVGYVLRWWQPAILISFAIASYAIGLSLENIFKTYTPVYLGLMGSVVWGILAIRQLWIMT